METRNRKKLSEKPSSNANRPRKTSKITKNSNAKSSKKPRKENKKALKEKMSRGYQSEEDNFSNPKNNKKGSIGKRGFKEATSKDPIKNSESIDKVKKKVKTEKRIREEYETSVVKDEQDSQQAKDVVIPPLQFFSDENNFSRSLSLSTVSVSDFIARIGNISPLLGKIQHRYAPPLNLNEDLHSSPPMQHFHSLQSFSQENITKVVESLKKELFPRTPPIKFVFGSSISETISSSQRGFSKYEQKEECEYDLPPSPRFYESPTEENKPFKSKGIRNSMTASYIAYSIYAIQHSIEVDDMKKTFPIFSKAFNSILGRNKTEKFKPELGKVSQSFAPNYEEIAFQYERPAYTRRRLWSFSDDMGCETQSQILDTQDYSERPAEEDEDSSSLETYLNALRDEHVDQMTGESNITQENNEKESRVVYEENYVNPIAIDNQYTSETLCLNLIPNDKTITQSPAKQNLSSKKPVINHYVPFEVSESVNSFCLLGPEVQGQNIQERMDEEEDEFSSFEIIEGTEDTEETLVRAKDLENDTDWHKVLEGFEDDSREISLRGVETKKGESTEDLKRVQTNEAAKEAYEIEVFQSKVNIVCFVALLLIFTLIIK